MNEKSDEEKGTTITNNASIAHVEIGAYHLRADREFYVTFFTKNRLWGGLN